MNMIHIDNTVPERALACASSLDLVVEDVRQESETVRSFVLVAPDRGQLPSFQAGAHIDLDLSAGMRRSYSLCNDPAERHRYVIAVHLHKTGKGGSRFMHECVRHGDRLRASLPRNSFQLVEEAPHSLLIAGGIGITPILSMARRLEALGRSWEMHYAARSREKAAFLQELETFAGERVRFYASAGDQPRKLDVPALLRDLGPSDHIYCCGPAGLIRTYLGETRDLPEERVHFERFTASGELVRTGGFTVELARSGGRYFVPEGKTILDVLFDAGLDVPFSCQQGICGTCRTRVLEGEPDHHDEVLTKNDRASGEVMMICCSRAKGARLVLDL